MTPKSTRDRILAVAEEIIARHGMAGLRLKDVAERVGIQPPSVFTHFEGREAIGDAVAQRVLEQIAAVLEEALEAGGSSETRLRRSVRAVAGHLHDHPGHARMILRDWARPRPGPELSLSQPPLDRIGARVDALVSEGVAAGELRPLPPGALMPVLVGAIVASVGWAGFRAEDGRPAGELGRDALLARVDDLTRAYVRPASDAADPAGD